MQSILKRLGLLAALFLSACASTEIQNMPANQLVSKGIDKAFEMPNYRFVASSGIDEFKMNLGQKSEDDKEMESFFNTFASNLSKNLAFEAVGVVDSPNKMYQIIPSYRYESKNLKGMAAFPIVYDGGKKHLFADLSAMDMFFNSPENSGKYSRFDLNRFAKHLDKTDKIMGVLKKNYMGHYNGLDQASFSEVPLNDEDKGNQVVRKVQVKTSVQKTLEVFPNVIKDVAHIFEPELKDAEKDLKGKAMDHDEQIEVQSGVFSQMQKASEMASSKEFTDMLNKFIAPGSEQIEVFGFNKKGEMVQSDVKTRVILNNPKPDEDNPASKEPIVMGVHSKIRLYDIGSAKLIDAPTAENSVDGVENLKKSFLGRIVVKLFEPTKAEKEVFADDVAPAATAVDAAKAAAAAVREPRKTKKSQKRKK